MLAHAEDVTTGTMAQMLSSQSAQLKGFMHEVKCISMQDFFLFSFYLQIVGVMSQSEAFDLGLSSISSRALRIPDLNLKESVHHMDLLCSGWSQKSIINWSSGLEVHHPRIPVSRLSVCDDLRFPE